MAEDSEVETVGRCPDCGQPMEVVHFSTDAAGLILYHGAPPDGILARLAEPFVGSLVTNDSGAPILTRFKQGYRFPAAHCPDCHQIILRYRD